MFDMREFVMKSLTDAAKVEPPYKVRETAATWHSKGILTEDDLAIIEGLLPSYGTTLEEAQATKQLLNNQALATYLEDHPLLWTDGELYSVTQEDQQLMLMYFSTYSIGLREKLEWNSHTKKCREFTVDEFKALSKAVNDFVEPLVKKCQEYKEEIYAAQSVEAVKAIVIDYSTVGQEVEGAENVG